jgi:hypothetical protein
VGGVKLLLALLVLAACHPEIAEQDTSQYHPIEEKIPIGKVAQNIQYEMETVSFLSKEGNSTDPDYRTVHEGQRLGIKLMLDKDHRVYMDIEMLEPQRGQQYRKRDQWYEATSMHRMQILDNTSLTYDREGTLINSQQIDASQVLLDFQLEEVDQGKENLGYGLLRVKAHQMTETEISIKAKAKGYDYNLVNESNFVMSHALQSTGEDGKRTEAIEVKEYYITGTGTLKGIEMTQGGKAIFRSAYSYKINGENYDLQRIYSETYQYDENSQLEGKVISNTYFKILN